LHLIPENDSDLVTKIENVSLEKVSELIVLFSSTSNKMNMAIIFV